MNRRRFFGALAGLAVVPSAEAISITESTWRFAQFGDSAPTAPPITGLDVSAAGVYVSNSSPVPLGAPGERYVVMGWVYTKGGWEEVRCLTGN